MEYCATLMDSWSRHTRIIGIPDNRHQLEDRSEFLHHTLVEHVKELLLNRPRNASIRWLLTRRVSHCHHITYARDGAIGPRHVLPMTAVFKMSSSYTCFFSFSADVSPSRISPNKKSFPHSPSSFIILRYSHVSRSNRLFGFVVIKRTFHSLCNWILTP